MLIFGIFTGCGHTFLNNHVLSPICMWNPSIQWPRRNFTRILSVKGFLETLQSKSSAMIF